MRELCGCGRRSKGTVLDCCASSVAQKADEEKWAHKIGLRQVDSQTWTQKSGLRKMDSEKCPDSNSIRNRFVISREGEPKSEALGMRVLLPC